MSKGKPTFEYNEDGKRSKQIEPILVQPPVDEVKGLIEIDSFLMVSTHISDFKTNVKFKVRNKPNIQVCQNTKATDRLKLMEKGDQHYEFRVGGWDTRQVFVLLSFNEDVNTATIYYLVNAYWQRVVWKSLSSMPSTSVFKMTHGRVSSEISDDDYTLTLSDWPLFCELVQKWTSRFKPPELSCVHFYKAIHGMKSDTPRKALDIILYEIVAKPAGHVFSQIHTAITLQSDRGQLVTEYDTIESVLFNTNEDYAHQMLEKKGDGVARPQTASNFFKNRNYFLQNSSFFHGARFPVR